MEKINNPILTCHWEITKKCNLKCIHCISFVGNKKELNTKEALGVINNLKNLGCKELYLTGGESLVRKDLFEILKEAKKKKIHIGIITNGILINKNNIRKIKRYVDELGVSLDGASPKINDAIRGKGTFKKIIQAINLISFHRIPFVLYFTLNQINLDDFGNILNLVKFLGIKRIKITEVSLRGRAYQNRSFLKLQARAKENLKRNLLKILKRYFHKIEKSWNQNCSIDPNTIFLSPLGYIYPCVEIFQKNPRCHFGNIRYINSKNFQKYREIISKLSKINKKCPYKEIKGSNFLLSLNNTFVKNCPIEKRLCRVKKSIH